ncbi:MAG: hypothetical protein VW362_04870, partial [Candidatus Nanopelagicales bacterium]
ASRVPTVLRRLSTLTVMTCPGVAVRASGVVTRAGGAWLGAAWLGAAWLGAARLGAARLGDVTAMEVSSAAAAATARIVRGITP